MDKMLEQLKEYGADTEGAMGRFLDDVDLYKTCLAAFLVDEAFPLLEKAIKEEHYEQAFEYAHTLKGITGNMGLTPLYRLICDIVEKLRRDDYTNLAEYYEQVQAHLDQLAKLQ